MSLRRFAVLLSFLTAVSLRADAPGVYAIAGGTVHPVSGPDIPNGVVIIRDGLIEVVGQNDIALPLDAMPIDAKNLHIYPGLIDAQTSLGMPAAPKKKSAKDDPLPETNPAFMAVEHLELADDDLDARRRTGVTTVVTAPSFGIFNGQSVVLNLSEGSTSSRVVRNPAAMQVSFNTRPTWTFPDSIMGVVAYIRQTLLDAQQYSAARAVYEKSPAGLERPANDTSLEALGSVLRRDLPVVFVADTELMIRRAQAIAAEFNVRYAISGARQAYRMADDLRGVPVLVAVNWPVAPANKDDREEQPLRIIRDRQLAPTSPAALARAGGTFALVSGAAKSKDFLGGIRKAIENGLSESDALKAVTLAPARIFGVDRQLGSLERGKIANVVISDKPIFTKGAKVTRVFVDGREVRLAADEKASGDGASAAEGTWHLSVRTPDGEVAIDVTLQAAGGKLTGTYSGARGSGDIRGGSVDEDDVEFTLSAEAPGGGETSDWAFKGTIDGDRMSGTVSTTVGTFQFTGSKSK